MDEKGEHMSTTNQKSGSGEKEELDLRDGEKVRYAITTEIGIIDDWDSMRISNKQKIGRIIFTDMRIVLKADGEKIPYVDSQYQKLTFFHPNNDEMILKIGEDPLVLTGLIMFERENADERTKRSVFFVLLNKPIYRLVREIDAFRKAYENGRIVPREKWEIFLGMWYYQIGKNLTASPLNIKTEIDYLFGEVEPFQQTDKFKLYHFGKLTCIHTIIGETDFYPIANIVVVKTKDAARYLIGLSHGLSLLNAKQIIEEALFFDPKNTTAKNNLVMIRLKWNIWEIESKCSQTLRSETYDLAMKARAIDAIKDLEKILEEDLTNYYIYKNLSTIYTFLCQREEDIGVKEMKELEEKQRKYQERARSLASQREEGGIDTTSLPIMEYF